MRQKLAGHSTPTLTAGYWHRRLYDLQGAVEKLPFFLPGSASAAETPLLPMTGTDGRAAPVCTGFAQTADTGRDFLRLAEAPNSGEGKDATGPNPRISQGVEAGCDCLKPLPMKAGDGGRTHDSHVGNVARHRAGPWKFPCCRGPRRFSCLPVARRTDPCRRGVGAVADAHQGGRPGVGRGGGRFGLTAHFPGGINARLRPGTG